MNRDDPYRDLAERYDLMKVISPVRENFFRALFEQYKVKSVLDCACGTGQDLIMFHSFGCDIVGSDISESMLSQAKLKIRKNKLDISLKKTDFRMLPEYFKAEFDAVVCLSNSINELLEDSDTVRALLSMKAVLKDGGILVVDQGQTDFSMRNPPRFAPIMNNRDFSRVFVMEYIDKFMEVNILDFIHTEKSNDFKHFKVRVRIRLYEDWSRLFKKADFGEVTFYGGWNSDLYDKAKSKRLIMVAQK